jgi:hypothetical protein
MDTEPGFSMKSVFRGTGLTPHTIRAFLVNSWTPIVVKNGCPVSPLFKWLVGGCSAQRFTPGGFCNIIMEIQVLLSVTWNE